MSSFSPSTITLNLLSEYSHLFSMIQKSFSHVKNTFYLHDNEPSNLMDFCSSIDQLLPKWFILNMFVYYDILFMVVEVYLMLSNLKETKNVFPENHNCHSNKAEFKYYSRQFSPFSFFYLYFTLFTPVFKSTDFESPLVLFSWWRNKIS